MNRACRLIATIALCVSMTAAVAGARELLGEEFVLSVRSTENARPAIASWESGRRLFVVWEGSIDGARRIVLRERVEGVWLPELVIDSEPAAVNAWPSVAVDSTGNPHVAWLGKIGNFTSVFYAFRAGDRWMNFGAVAGTGDQNAEAVTVQVSPNDKPYIVWQSGAGSQYSIRCATVSSGGELTTENLTPNTTTLNHYPELFFLPEPLITWYRSEDSSFALVGRRFDAESGQWRPYEFQDLNQLPANRLPLILRSSFGQFVGMWYDELDFVDRVFLGFQDSVTQGAGAVIDNQPDSINHLVSGTSAGEELVAVWCSIGSDSGPQVYLSHGTALPFADDVRISDGKKSYYTDPRVTPADDGVAVVWCSDSASGGNGNVFLRNLSFAADSPEK